jgi:hypothetical protein
MNAATAKEIALLKHPCGVHVKMEYRRRLLLGEIVDFDVRRDGTLRLYVKHFNGEFWPINPLSWEVYILERTYTSEVDQ